MSEHQKNPEEECKEVFNLKDKIKEDDIDIIDFQLSSNKINIKIPFFQLLKYSQYVQHEYLKNEIIKSLSDQVKEIQRENNIKEENISIFFKLLDDEQIEISIDQYCDLFKLSKIFKVKPLQTLLAQYLKNHSQNVDLIINLLIGQISTENDNTNMEECLYSNIDKCIKNQNFNKLPVSTIHRILEKSDKQNISSDILYDFIAKSIKDRYPLLVYINLKNLSNEKFNDLCQSESKKYFDYLHVDLDFIKELKNEVKKLQHENKTLFKEKSQLNNQNNHLQNEINEMKNLNSQLHDQIKKDQNVFQTQINNLSKENNEIKVLNQQNKETLQEKINKLEEENHQLQIQNQKLQENENQSQKQINELKTLNNQLNTQLIQLMNEIKTLNNQEQITFELSYQIKGIEGQFIIPIRRRDTVEYVSQQIQKEFGIISNLAAMVCGSELQSKQIISQCVRSQDVVVFDVKSPNKFELYRQPIIIPRYQSNSTFIVFTTLNYQSMTKGNKIKIDIKNDSIKNIQEKIKDMIKKNYEINDSKLKSMKIFLFLPGGVPFLNRNIEDFTKSFENYMPHLYAIIVYNNDITDKVLDEIYDTVCNLNNNELKMLISPDYDSEINGLCEIASVLGYIQHNGLHTKRMIYSIAKFCPFAPMICGLHNLTSSARPTGRTILQITAPLLQLFLYMGNKFSDQSNIFSFTTKFLTYFMNIQISDRVPCTEFTRPFYNIGFEKYFYDNFTEEEFPNVQSIIVFDPDFKDQDWIRFNLSSLENVDFDNALTNERSLEIIPPLSLREMHRPSLFRGKNGPWLFLSAPVSKEEAEKDKVDYINPEKGEIEHDTYEDLAVKCINANYKNKDEEKKFDELIMDAIDPDKVSQLVFFVIDKSGSMLRPYGQDLNRFQASQKFFIKFTETCYKFHTTNLYGSILFSHEIIVRNSLNPLVSNCVERMLEANDRPEGGTRLFTGMKKAADLLLEANKGNRYKNAVLRLIVISDGEDGCGKSEQANVSNYILQNKIRVDAIIISNEIAKELVAISHYTGGIAAFPRSIEEGFELISKEEFFNINLRQFGSFRSPNVTAVELQRLPRPTPDQLDKNMKIKTNEFADQNKLVTSPLYAVSEFEKVIKSESCGASPESFKVYINQKRIIYELRKIMSNKMDDIIVFPLKDRIDVWRVLLKGIEGSLYQGKWFFMIIEFPYEYPQHYPLFRFIHPPFHLNITDQGLVCIDALDQNYRSDMSIIDLIAEIKHLLLQPNFDNCVDLKREKLKMNRQEFDEMIQQWNNNNGKNTPEEWGKQWKIQPDDNLDKNMEIKKVPLIPKQYICPISRKIMKNPVKSSTGIFYEKSALEKYMKTIPNPDCKIKKDSKGKPEKLDTKIELKIDNEMKAMINKWIKDNDYHDDDENDENENIVYFRSTKKIIKEPIILKLYKEGSLPEKNEDNKNASSIYCSSARPRPQLSDI